MIYNTYINLKKKSSSRSNKKRPVGKNSKRHYNSSRWRKKLTRKTIRNSHEEKFFSSLFVLFGFVVFIAFSLVIASTLYVQNITNDLPSPEKPFGNKNIASEMYDRDGNLLYKVFGDENRDVVALDDIPPLLVWSFLAAEDKDFYEHNGIDLKSMLRCGLINFTDQQVSCGGSTITQQLIKQTALSSEQKYERKIKEIILAFQIEKMHSKDEILEMYLTVAPEGSNIYSVGSAADFYFGKNVQDLTLAEMSILASIPQSPSLLSPTKSTNPELMVEKLAERQTYVLDQMEKNIDIINAHISQDHPDLILTKEMIDAARIEKIEYKNPRFNIKAPHFVFYAEKLLQNRPYNNGMPFTLAELETGGYKIWTSLNSDYQKVAEEQVRKGVDIYGARYGGKNAAMVVMDPKTGEVLSMVGSYDYWGKPYPEGCTLGINCKFEPNVNIPDTLQSYGSSMKPMFYYYAMMDGIITPGSQIPDIPIEIGDYRPKNYEGGFFGIKSARWMLSNSRNIPAIYLADQMGVDRLVEDLKKWGYTTLNNPYGYGPSITVGGGDVKLIDHAQAYTVFANGGEMAKHEVILKIEDRDGNIIYEHEPERTAVADPRGVYMINDILNGRKNGPGYSWDGRDIAGKTGTSEAQKETLFATYTPEIVVVGWLGNNDNSSMWIGASGFGTARPWISEFVKRVGDTIPKTPFTKPSGVIYRNGDLAMSGVKVPSYITKQAFLVCVDEPNLLARPIDMDMGFAMEIEIKSYRMPNPKMQVFLNNWMKSENMFPVGFCTIDRMAPTPTPSIEPTPSVSITPDVTTTPSDTPTPTVVLTPTP